MKDSSRSFDVQPHCPVCSIRELDYNTLTAQYHELEHENQALKVQIQVLKEDFFKERTENNEKAEEIRKLEEKEKEMLRVLRGSRVVSKKL